MKPRADIKTTVNKVKSDVSRPLDNNPPSVETMRVMVHAESEKRKKAGDTPLNCYVLEKNELESFMSELSKSTAQLDHFIRIQIIVKTGPHFTALDMKLSKDHSECFILDAANAPGGLLLDQYIRGLKKETEEPLFSNVYMAAGKRGENLQFDYRSCPAFSLDHVCQVSRIENIYEIVSKEQKGSYVDWKQLPPSLVCNSQSLTWIKAYKEANPTSGQETILGARTTFDQYLAAGTKTAVIKGVEREVNASSDILYAKHQEETKKFMGKHSSATIDSIATTKPTFESLSQQASSNRAIKFGAKKSKGDLEKAATELYERAAPSSSMLTAQHQSKSTNQPVSSPTTPRKKI